MVVETPAGESPPLTTMLVPTAAAAVPLRAAGSAKIPAAPSSDEGGLRTGGLLALVLLRARVFVERAGEEDPHPAAPSAIPITSARTTLPEGTGSANGDHRGQRLGGARVGREECLDRELGYRDI